MREDERFCSLRLEFWFECTDCIDEERMLRADDRWFCISDCVEERSVLRF